MNKIVLFVAGILAFISASQSSLFSSAEPVGAVVALPSCKAEQTLETITLTGDFGIFTTVMCPEAPLR